MVTIPCQTRNNSSSLIQWEAHYLTFLREDKIFLILIKEEIPSEVEEEACDPLDIRRFLMIKICCHGKHNKLDYSHIDARSQPPLSGLWHPSHDLRCSLELLPEGNSNLLKTFKILGG